MKKFFVVLLALIPGIALVGCAGAAIAGEGDDVTAFDIADEISFITAPAQGDTFLTLPVEPGFTITITTSDDTGVIALDGTITPPDVETAVYLTLLVENDADETDTAITDPLAVVVPATSAETITVWVATPDWSGAGTNLRLWFSGNGGDGWATTYSLTNSFNWDTWYSVDIPVTDAAAETRYHVQFTQDGSTKYLVNDVSSADRDQPANWVALTTSTDIISIDLAGNMTWGTGAGSDRFSLDSSDFGTTTPPDA